MTGHDQREEAGLLDRISRGDTAAFDRIYTLWAPMLYGLVCKILDDPREAEDVLQEGFMHVWQKATTYRAERSSPTTWACMVFRNKAIDRLRSRERRGRGIERIASEMPPAALPTEVQADGAETNERRRAVTAALADISTEERQAIDLAYFSGLTQVEIAERLGEPLGTIKARIRRGLMKLATSLEGTL